jgi:hypothetical protein
MSALLKKEIAIESAIENTVIASEARRYGIASSLSSSQ